MKAGTVKRIALVGAAVAMTVSLLTPASALGASGIKTGTAYFHYTYCIEGDLGGCGFYSNWNIGLTWSGSYNGSNSIGTSGYPVVYYSSSIAAPATTKFSGYGRFVGWKPTVTLRRIYGVGNGTYFQLNWYDSTLNPFPSFGPTSISVLKSRVWLSPSGGTSCLDDVLGVPQVNRYGWTFDCWSNYPSQYR